MKNFWISAFTLCCWSAVLGHANGNFKQRAASPAPAYNQASYNNVNRTL